MFEGWEWIIIGIIALVVILWGPTKIPELARALGRAKGEFEKASREYEVAAATAPSTPSSTAYNVDNILFETARKLGIPTEGKTRAQISNEIAERVKVLGSA